VTGRATYGDLLRDTTHALAVANTRLVSAGFTSQAEAQRAVAAYRDTADGLGVLGSRLVQPANRLTAVADRSHPDDRVAAGARLAARLQGLGRPTPWTELGDEPSLPGPAGAWRSAAQTARTAQDLLATYWDPHGVRSAPLADQLEDVDQRAGALLEYAGLASTVADAADPLAVRAVAAGIPAQDAEDLVAAAEAVTSACVDVRFACHGADPQAFDTVQVARPTIRTDQPLTEVTDRVARLHRFAWELVGHDRVGAGTLSLYAAAGFMLNSALGQLIEQVNREPDRADSSLLGIAKRADEQAQGWRTVHRHLAVLRTATPPAIGVRADVARINDQLRQLLDPQHPSPTRALPTLLHSTDLCGDVARWNLTTLEGQVARGEVWLVGKAIPRDLTSDRTELAAAKVNGTVVRAPERVVAEATRSYAEVRSGRVTQAVQPPPGGPPLGLG
jgi:hypothetical protein